jgi:hypothetical protein
MTPKANTKKKQVRSFAQAKLAKDFLMGNAFPAFQGRARAIHCGDCVWAELFLFYRHVCEKFRQGLKHGLKQAYNCRKLPRLELINQLDRAFFGIRHWDPVTRLDFHTATAVRSSIASSALRNRTENLAETPFHAASVPGLYQNRPPPPLTLAFLGRTVTLIVTGVEFAQAHKLALCQPPGETEWHTNELLRGVTI